MSPSKQSPISNRLSLWCMGLLLLVQALLLVIERETGLTSLAEIFACAIALALVGSALFRFLALRQLPHLNDVVNKVMSLGKGDLTVKLAWANKSTTATSANAVLNNQVEQLAQAFAENFRAPFSLDTQNSVSVGNLKVPVLRCGGSSLNQDNQSIDRLTGNTPGSVATIFVRRGDDLVRIATSIKKSDGTRVVGTMLDRSRPMYKQLIRGEVFSGVAQLFGRFYITRYTPIRSADHQIIGALFVGVEEIQTANSGDEITALGMGVNSLAEEFGEFVGGISKAAEAVAQAAMALAAHTEQVAKSSHLQSEAASAAVGAVEQMTVSIDHIVARAVNTEQISMETSTLCDDGERVIDNASREIETIAKTVAELSLAIESLGQRSSEVGGIVQVIREIADQTNLLALNAAIEAARAGETGRGFAVVADEVRKLAERTGQATIEITKMIGSIRSEIDHAVGNMNAGKAQVERGVSTVDQASDSLVTIKSGSHKIEDMIREISAATHQQSGASAEIARNIETVADMAKQNNTVIKDVAAAAANLEQMSSNLQNMANRFKV